MSPDVWIQSLIEEVIVEAEGDENRNFDSRDEKRQIKYFSYKEAPDTTKPFEVAQLAELGNPSGHGGLLLIGLGPLPVLSGPTLHSRYRQPITSRYRTHSWYITISVISKSENCPKRSFGLLTFSGLRGFYLLMVVSDATDFPTSAGMNSRRGMTLRQEEPIDYNHWPEGENVNLLVYVRVMYVLLCLYGQSNLSTAPHSNPSR
jgi:hypothetical protein